METKVKVFIAYAHEDMDLKEELVRHLKGLTMREVLEVWHDGEIKPGVKWESDIHDNLDKADIILMLLSAYSLDSDYFLEKELKKILERNRTQKCIAVPIILRPCQWQSPDLANLQALPEGGKPVVNWPDQHEVLNEIAAKVKERAMSVVADRNRRVQELELELEKHLRDDRRNEAQAVLEKLKKMLESFGETGDKIASFEHRVAEVEKIQRLRDYLKKLENAEESKDWDTAKSLLDREEVRFEPKEIAASKKADLINSLSSNIEDTANRIRRKSDSAKLDANAEKAFVRKDYEEAKALWEEANLLENKSERINRIRQCEERIGVRKKAAEFEDKLEQARKSRETDPGRALELLEDAIQMVKDERLESSEESERVKERLKAALQELDEIKNQVEINEYAVLLKKADKALDDELYHVALNHFLAAQEINPGARKELEQKIQTCRLKMRVQLLREAAGEFERKKDYIREQGMYIALVQLSPDDVAAKKKIEMIEEILEGIDKDYAQSRAKGERLLLQKQYEEAIKYFDHCRTIKPDDNYVSTKKEEAQGKLETHQLRDNARTHLNTGKEYFKKERFGEAQKQFSKALRFAPGNEEIKQNLKCASQMLWAERFFALKLFSLAKRAYLKTSPEITNSEFVEQRIAVCEQNQKILGTYSMRYGKWALLPLIVVAVGMFVAKMNNANRIKQFRTAIEQADALIQQGSYAEAVKICNDAMSKARNGQDSSRAHLRSEAAGALLVAANLEKQANEAGAPVKAISLQDSAIALIEIMQQTFEKIAGDTTLSSLKTLLKHRFEQMEKRRKDLAINQNLEPLKAIIRRGNTNFGSKDYKQALSIYEQTEVDKHLIPLLPRSERAEVRKNLTVIQSHYSSQANALNPSIFQKNEELRRAEGYLIPPREQIRRLRTELADLSKTKSSHEALAAWASRLIDRFR